MLLWTGFNAENTLSKRWSSDGVTWLDQNKRIYWGFGSLDGPAAAGTAAELLKHWTNWSRRCGFCISRLQR